MDKDVINQTQNTKVFHSKLWLSVICVLLSISLVAIVCLGVALSASNDKIDALQTDLNGVNEKVATLNTDRKTDQSEIEALQGTQSLADEELESLIEECKQLKEALQQSVSKQNGMEERINSLENTNRTTQNEIDKIKSDLETVNKEIADLKSEIADLKSEIADLKSEIADLKSEIADLKSEIADLTEEITDLKEQLTDSTDKIRIYIDQGHNPTSYHNTGASGNGLYEQDVTFLIGTLLAELLRADGRFEIQLSRPNKSVVLGTDNASSIMARVEGAEAFNADYLISLHTNSFTQESANGIEVYVEEKGSEAYAFGEALLNGLLDATNLGNRGVKLEPDLDILEFSSMPSALLEMGFISNVGDATLLAEHPELFAQGIYSGILDYFGFLPKNIVTN